MSNATLTKPVRNRARKRNSELAASDFCRLCKICFVHAYDNFTTKENGQRCRSVRRICSRRETVQNELFRHTLKMILGLSESKARNFLQEFAKNVPRYTKVRNAAPTLGKN